MAKGNNNGNGGSAPKNTKTVEQMNAERRASKMGKNKPKPSQPKTSYVSPTRLIKDFDAFELIKARALNSKSVSKLRAGSPSNEIAVLVINSYGTEERRSGGNPLEWHIKRRSYAVETAKEFMGELWLKMNRQAFEHGATVATNALNDAYAETEVYRTRELRDLERRKFAIEEVIARFIPSPASPVAEDASDDELVEAISA